MALKSQFPNSSSFILDNKPPFEKVSYCCLHCSKIWSSICKWRKGLGNGDAFLKTFFAFIIHSFEYCMLVCFQQLLIVHFLPLSSLNLMLIYCWKDGYFIFYKILHNPNHSFYRMMRVKTAVGYSRQSV